MIDVFLRSADGGLRLYDPTQADVIVVEPPGPAPVLAKLPRRGSGSRSRGRRG